MLDFPLHFPGTNATLPWTNTQMSATVVLVALAVVMLTCCGAAALIMVACCGGRRRDAVGESGDSRWLPGVGVIDYVPTSNRSSIRVSLVMSESTDGPVEDPNTASTFLTDQAASNSSISMMMTGDNETRLSPPRSLSAITLPAVSEETESRTTQSPHRVVSSVYHAKTASSAGSLAGSSEGASEGHCLQEIDNVSLEENQKGVTLASSCSSEPTEECIETPVCNREECESSLGPVDVKPPISECESSLGPVDVKPSISECESSLRPVDMTPSVSSAPSAAFNVTEDTAANSLRDRLPDVPQTDPQAPSSPSHELPESPEIFLYAPM